MAAGECPRRFVAVTVDQSDVRTARAGVFDSSQCTPSAALAKQTTAKLSAAKRLLDVHGDEGFILQKQHDPGAHGLRFLPKRGVDQPARRTIQTVGFDCGRHLEDALDAVSSLSRASRTSRTPAAGLLLRRETADDPLKLRRSSRCRPARRTFRGNFQRIAWLGETCDGPAMSHAGVAARDGRARTLMACAVLRSAA